MALHSSIIHYAEHFFVLLHCIALKNLNEFQGHNKANGDIGAVEDEIRAEGNSCYFTTIGSCRLQDKVLKGVKVDTGKIVKKSTASTAEKFKQKNEKDDFIDPPFNVAGFTAI